MKDDSVVAPDKNSSALTTDSRAVRVTFFEDRAEVVRTASTSVDAGLRWVSIAGVSPYVDERSVQARVVGDAVRVLSARVVFRAHHEAALGREEIDALERESLAARQRVVAALMDLDRAEKSEARAAALVGRWASAVAAVPQGVRRPESLEAWRAALDAIERDARASSDAAAEARLEHARAEEDMKRAEVRIEQGSIERPRIEALIEVQLDAARAQSVDIELTYRVPCALFRPEHVARLVMPSDSDPSASVEIITYATAWQCAGERWDGIKARFSTARPARSAAPPTLTDDVLSARRKTDLERSRIKVEAREQAIVLAGLDRGSRAVEEMPGVDDGGEPVTFEKDAPVSIPSDGRPFRVEIARRALDAKIERVLFPEVAPAAHIRATATLTREGPLLAGPLRLVRGQSLVGRSKLAFVGAGEPFEIGFGADDGVRVRRAQEEERDTTVVTGTQKLRRTVKVYLSNLSGEARTVQVTERVPVSEIDDVQVSIVDASAWKLDEKDGFARTEVTLKPRGTHVLKIVYEIRASAKVVMPF